MGILQNILKSINTAIDNIDFSPYQLISNKSTDGTLADNSDTLYPSQKAVKTYADTKQSALGYTAENQANKNAASGYLGLDSNARFDPKAINTKTIYYVYESFQNKGSLISNTSSSSLGSSLGSGFTTSNHQVNAINGNTSVKIYRSGLSISSGVASSTGAILYSGDFCQLSSPAKVRLRTKVYFERNAPSTSQVIEVGYLNQAGASRTGVFFAQDPTVNSGNWRIGKSLAGSDTYENTNIAYTDSAITEFELYYDKSTEICDYYINGTLAFSLTAVNCANATMLPIWKLITNSATQTTLRRLVICDLYWALEL